MTSTAVSIETLPASATRRLTPAELRVLVFLPTHLSFRQIASEVSRPMSTVTSQTQRIYRKLGATSRHDAVVRARAAGLERHRGVCQRGSAETASRAPAPSSGGHPVGDKRSLTGVAASRAVASAVAS
jgi:DNA-binding CsgD family transcriptional regulator